MQHQLISGVLAAYLQKCSVESKKYCFVIIIINVEIMQKYTVLYIVTLYAVEDWKHVLFTVGITKAHYI